MTVASTISDRSNKLLSWFGASSSKIDVWDIYGREYVPAVEFETVAITSNPSYNQTVILRRTEAGNSLFADVDSLLKELQEQGVKLLSQQEIRGYLLSFPALIDVTRRAVIAVLRHMPEAQLVMEVYHDPEIEDNYLVIYARLREYDESSLERIEAAESEYIDLLSDKEGWIQLSTDFREPESA